ncbi:MerR family DNA-binding protein, partial [Bittarella massiliensis (ex Durand et al. 2017)]|nr:MerR family DNA-binding protein [Bittarella massiliensis (ex Durand et al. 2017)]
NVIRDLRGLGFSMERIREYLTNRSIDTTELLLNEELNAIHRKMAQLRQLQSNVEQRLATLQTAKEQPLETVT